MNMYIRQTTITDAPNVAELLEDARKYKNSIGDTAWGDEPFTNNEVEALLANGVSYIAFIDEIPAGFANTTTEDPRLWGDTAKDEKGLYIHRFVSSSMFRGRGIGKEMLDFLGNKAVEQDKKYLRLDCETTNPKLQNYYINQGFNKIGTKDMERYVACLLEKQISTDT